MYQVIFARLPRSLSTRLASKCNGDSLPVCENWWQISYELPYLACEDSIPLVVEQSSYTQPTGDNLHSCLGEPGVRRMRDRAGRCHLSGDAFNLFSKRI